MNIQLSDHFTYKKLLKFTLPSIGMMIVTSIYGVVDGLFVSNIVGKDAFAGLNLIYPAIALLASFGLLIGTGGSALVAKTFGEEKPEKANQIFTMLIFLLVTFGIVCAVFGNLFVENIAILLGADDTLLGYCVIYGRILLTALPLFMLQMAFQAFLITAEKPHMAFILAVCAGITNMIFDFLLIYVFPLGLAGAAIATVLGQMVGGIIPLVYFSKKNSSILRFVKFTWDGRALLQAATNGLSEMVSNVSFSFLNMLYNYQLMRMIGADGVAAYGLIMYIAFIFAGVYMGFSMGSAPVIAYHYGAQNHEEMHNLLKKGNVLIGISAILLTVGAELAAPFLAWILVGYDAELLALSVYALRTYSICFIFAGFNVFASAFFTALNNGPVSAFLSGTRLLVFEASMVILIPMIWGVDGIWFSVAVAEILANILSIATYRFMNKKYQYL